MTKWEGIGGKREHGGKEEEREEERREEEGREGEENTRGSFRTVGISQKSVIIRQQIRNDHGITTRRRRTEWKIKREEKRPLSLLPSQPSPAHT